MGENDTIPVTVVCGYLGAGKTTLINHLLSNPGDHDIAVIVNDMGEVNVDADLLTRESDEEGVVDLSNGCICCELGDDLATETERLAESREFDVLVVEASGISEPIPIAQTMVEDTADRLELDTMVTVLDSFGFWNEFDPENRQPDSDVERPLSTVFIDGIEFCDVLLLNKTDLLSDDALGEIEATVRELQPRAHIERTEYSRVDPDLVLDTGRFDFEEARQSQGWKRSLAHDHDEQEHSPAEAHGVTSFVYRETQPLHPERFANWLDDWTGEVIRAKGICRIAGREEEVIGLSQAGPSVEAGPIGRWDPERDDPRTELVFIGRSLDETAIREGLDSCLVDARAGEWDPAADPFPL
ncbi:CobW family GTP-binding protein [Natranaeroarchaeum sulfidigenes]|uniref:GTPase, G3E family n=1 Tax=Natranaeroarchaeum sulfidigenes TaxID=2784880 RepID=A0A897MXW5_9EURY|nr:GTP-binding protein [Natranaeroarchaeum sulfidigenes]QSG02986.1 GTPase, G3E family [Natranaeroarchaeum sulfidigenes]